jgi:methyl-accepting chemotaxis protein
MLILQKKSLEDYFFERTRNLENLVDNVQIQQQEMFSKMETIKSLKKKQVEDYFRLNLQNVDAFVGSPQQKKVFADYEVEGHTAFDQYQSFYATWGEDRNFDSVMIISRAGQVIYSNDKAIKSGVFVKSKTGTPELAAFVSGLKSPSFTDFGKSSLRDNATVAYFSAPVKNNSKVSGVVLFSVNSKVLDGIMHDITGLGETGEGYLVGRDRMFRSNSRLFDEDIVISPAFLVDTHSVDEAIEGRSGNEILINYRGEYVLSSFVATEVAGMTWALVVEVDLSEAMAVKQEGEEQDYLATYADTYGYPDLYMIDQDGYIFYTARQQADYQTNILNGPYADSGFAKIVEQVIEKGTMVVSDYSRYAPAGDKVSAFLAKPVIRNDKIQMIIALQIPIDQVSAIMKNHGGLSESGDTYLVGADKLWRTESLQTANYNVKSTLLNPKVLVDTKPVRDALAGKSGTEKVVNGAGIQVLASWAPFVFNDLHWAIINEVSQTEVGKPVGQLFKTNTMMAVASVLAVFLLSFLISGGITKQVGSIMKAMTRVEEGDFDTRAAVVSKDELGAMASSFNQMIGNTKSMMESRAEEHEQLQESIMGMLMEISDLSEGDMTVRATVREDATGTVADSLNMMLEELSGTISKIKRSSEQVGMTANNLSSSTADLALRSESQSELIKGAVKDIEEMTTAIEQAAVQANTSAETSKLSTAAATEGTKAVEETSRAMEAIRGNVQDTARAIKRLGESSQEISDFAKTINDISDRTSILALNASIQAAAAGEEGRGFAVVAEEIQRLAERAAGSTRQIETLIKNILGEITDASASMDSSIQEVVQGTKLSEDALAKLKDIDMRSTVVANLIATVSRATGEQAENAVKVAGVMGEIGVISTESANETRNTSSSMRDMARVADEMLQSVATFKLPEEEVDGEESISLTELMDSENA